MGCVTQMLSKSAKRKSDGESCIYYFRVSNVPPNNGSYSFDGVFYYIPGKFRESNKKVKPTKSDQASSPQ